ncbi:MAG: radical SAM protein, partial [Firmicutes bacterium]|nr:radical SAM protein [Bacillota bacterium]
MPPLFTMIKPVSGVCNMRCAYCFYRDVAEHRAVASYGVMDDGTLEVLVRRAFAYAEGSVSFAFQGGEPTLAGLAFFEKLVRLQSQYEKRGLQVHNAIQTNGLAIDDAFAAFLAKHHFLVGLSIDGTQSSHDALRLDMQNSGTFDRVMQAASILRNHRVETNILCVVTAQIAAEPEKPFEALSPFGYVQYIPCLDGFDGTKSAYSLSPLQYGEFLIKTFALYERSYRREKPVSIRAFDNYLQMIAGYPPEHCGMSGRCGSYFLIESDGSVYP